MIKMARSFNILLFLTGILIIYTNSSFDCSIATQKQCGSGLCVNHIWSNATCLPYTNIYCSQGSKWSNSTQNCIQCSSLSNDQCTVICSDFYWSSAGTNSTQSCLSCKTTFGQGCSSCSNLSCTSCFILKGIELQLTGGICIDPYCGITNCLECSSKTTCGVCNAKFVVNSNATQCISSLCSEPYCITCTGTTCSDCALGYKLSEGKCKLNCNDKNCIQCSQIDVCGLCMTGYLLNPTLGICVVDCTNKNIANCYQCLDEVKCQSCLSGYKLSFGGTQCTPICNSTKCDICSTNSSVCAQCNSGYKLVGTVCQDDICVISNCISCSSTTICATCASNYVYNATVSLCQPVCKNTQPNCLICSSASVCSSCGQGYKLSASSAVQCQPLCTISSCQLCASSTSCLICSSGYKLSTDGLLCKLDCGVNQCDICSSSVKCSSCNSGYSLSGNLCLKSCKKGFINVGGSVVTCQSCQSVIPYCESCSKIGDSILCSVCSMTYYLASPISCLKCSTAISNCLSCSSRTQCTSCVYPYVVQIDGTCAIVSCSVNNCELCSKISSSLCVTCGVGFTLQSDGTCLAPSCPQGAALIDGACACGNGLYLSGGVCVRCADSKCTTCTSASVCTACAKGYFPSGSSCVSCSNNCDSCYSATVCTLCSQSFTLDGGLCRSLGQGISAAKKGSKFFPCEPGCASCEVSASNEIICTKMMQGYTSLGGIYTKCSSSCLTCAPGQSNTCTSCFQSSVLIGGTCIACSDPKSLSCLGANRNYSLSCLNGYSAAATASSSGGYCLPCAQNCSKCENAGPGNCDKGQCQLGLVILTGTNNCTACFDSCSICDTDDLNKCLDCGPKRYVNNSKCYTCPIGCKVCTSATVCTGCESGYSLMNSSCIANSKYPCSGLSNIGQCSDCFAGYQLNALTKKCDKDLSCNTASNCQICPYGYYLNTVSKTCVQCNLDIGCLTCDSLNSVKCAQCEKKYYLNSSGLCNSCSSNCIDCISSTYCNEAASGYYISLNLDGSSSGRSLPCNSPCLTCSYNPDFCLSCVTGFSISGTICQFNKTIDIQLVLAASSNSNSVFQGDDLSETAVKKTIRSSNRFIRSMCENIPQQYKKQDTLCKKKIRIKSFKWGSIIASFQISAAGIPDASKAASSISGIILNNGIDGLNVIKQIIVITNITYNPQQPVAQNKGYSDINLGLVLGVATPIILLTFMGIGYTVLAQGKLISSAILQLKDVVALPAQTLGELNNIDLNLQIERI